MRDQVSQPYNAAGNYNSFNLYLLTFNLSTAVEQEVACAPVTQRARVRSPVGTSFLAGVFPHLQDKFQEALGPQGPRISFGIHTHPSIITLFE